MAAKILTDAIGMIHSQTEQTTHFPSTLSVYAQRGGVEIVDRLADEWRDLCDQSADDQPFYRPEFIRAHIRAKIPGAKVVVITVRQEGRLRLLLPLVEELGTFSKVPVRKLRSPVDMHCGRFDAVRCSGPESDAVMSATWNYLKEMDSWDLLQLRYAPQGSAVSRLFSMAEGEGFLTIQEPGRPNPYVPVPAAPELLERMPRSSRLRTKLRQIRRQIGEKSPMKFYRVDQADPDALDRLFALEASGWKGQDGGAVNCNPSFRQFFRELADSAARFGYFSLYMLEVEGQLIAAHYSLVYRERCHSPIVAFNEKFREFAPGHLIVGEILRDCMARGITGYDITGEDQEWKMKWTDQALSVNHFSVFKGRIGRMAYGVGVRLKPSLRRILS